MPDSSPRQGAPALPPPPAPPTITGLDPRSDSGALGDNITNVFLPRIVGRSAPLAHVSIFSVKYDAFVGDTYADADGFWSCQDVIGRSDASDPTDQGPYGYSAVQNLGDGGGRSARSSVFDTMWDAVAPSALALSNSSVAAGSAANTEVGTFSAFDENGTALSFALDDGGAASNNARFTIVGDKLFLLDSRQATTAEDTVIVKVLDQAGNASSQTFKIAVTAPAQPAAPARPTGVSLAAASDSGVAGDGITAARQPSVNGSGAAGNLVKLFDTDGSTVLASATVNADGTWQLLSAALADGKHGLTVKQFDPSGLAASEAVALELTVDGTAPTALTLSNASIANNAGANTVVGTLLGVDAGGAALSYALVDSALGKDNVHFAIRDGQLIMLQPSASKAGAETITVQVTDAAGNTMQKDLTVLVQASPPQPTPEPDPVYTAPLVDGVAVNTGATWLPGLGLANIVAIPVVSIGRADSTGASATADIPLASVNGVASLTAHLQAGLGLTATGNDSQPAGKSLDHLMAAINAATADHTGTDQAYLGGGGQAYLGLVAADASLQVERIALADAAGAPSGTLTLAGAGQANQHTALVIDALQLHAAADIVLQNVGFAAVVGAAGMSGDTTGQILAGDSAAQQFKVAAGAASTVLAGGGDDLMQFGLAGQEVAAAAAKLDTLLNGGTGNDGAKFLGARSAYLVEQHDGYLTVASKAAPNQVVNLVNVERLQFADAIVNLQARQELTTLAGLYQNILGRQADAVGFDFWGQTQSHGESLGAVALQLITSAEGKQAGYSLNGDIAHDVDTLYRAVFHRDADAGGLAYWTAALQHGATLSQVADGFVSSIEMVGYNKAQASWDFTL
jgi:hypothetical protein